MNNVYLISWTDVFSVMVDRGTSVDVLDSHLLIMSTKEGGLKTNNC